MRRAYYPSNPDIWPSEFYERMAKEYLEAKEKLDETREALVRAHYSERERGVPLNKLVGAMKISRQGFDKIVKDFEKRESSDQSQPSYLNESTK